MHIDETTFPVEDAWTGDLVQAQETFASGFRGRGGALPRVSLGKPDWWSDQAVLGKTWHPPDGGQRYGLVRFKFSLRPEAYQKIDKADFTVRLLPAGGGPNPVAYDVYPQQITTPRDSSVKIGLGPSLSFGEVEGSLGSVETTLDTTSVVPVITASGLGESTIRWTFDHQRDHLLTGSRVVYALIELPPGISAVRASLHLSARVQHTNLGLWLTGLLPETDDEAQKSWLLGA